MNNFRDAALDKRIGDFFSISRGDKAAGDLLVGVELEAEGEKLPLFSESDHSKFWKMVPEGSLRDGAEYVLKKPLTLDKFTEALDDWEILTADTEFYNSRRTSTHVHVNAMGLSVREVLHTFGTYLLVEEALINMHGPTRKGNLFCLSGSVAEGLVNKLIDELRRGALFEKTLQDGYRYAAFNLAALGKFGSLEFRFMKGMYDRHSLLKWVSALQQFVRKAAGIPNLAYVIKGAQTAPPGQFLKLFFNPFFVEEIIQANPDIGSLLQRNLPLVSELALALAQPQKTQKIKVTEDEDFAPEKSDDTSAGAYFKAYTTTTGS